MSTLIGILVDVSGSMRNSVGDRVDVEGGSWARSIFKVVDELIKHDVPSSNQTFALAFGSPYHPEVFDLLTTVDKAQEIQSFIEDARSTKSQRELIDEALTILETNGASRVRTWGKMNVLLKVLDHTTAATILHFLQKSSEFTNKFVYDCLPKECRELSLDGIGNIAVESSYFMAGWVPFYGSQVQGWATENSVKEVVKKSERLIAEEIMVGISKAAIKSVPNASEILHASVGDQELTDKRVDELLKAVEPYIYGGTPLIRAMHYSVDLLSYPEFANHQKLLFILSDGQPGDKGDPPIQQLSDLGVTIVSCFITDQQLSDPCHLYSILHESWEKPAKTMFRMSSTITTQKIPRTLFVKRGWKIDIDNNETRLFFQVNNPEIIKDVCDMAKNGVLSQDALSDILSSVDLDIYINQASEGFGAQRQHGKTCYANATAAVLHLAMKRIIRRNGGYPDFFELRRKMIAKFGVQGAPTIKVLKEICPTYRLQCQEVDAVGAMKAISERRPVVARFKLTGAQWDQFYQFYEENPKGILTRAYLDSKNHSTGKSRGHAVVLTSYDAESLRLMNSRGDDWADNGFFRVQNSDVLGLKFVDVFWTLDNLSQEEKRAYDQHGGEVAAKLMRSLKGIQMAKYECPLCAVESLVVNYSGHLLKANCPKCGGTFNANQEDCGDLALNLYLTSMRGSAEEQTSSRCTRKRFKALQL